MYIYIILGEIVPELSVQADWIIIAGVLASLLIISWSIFMITCVVALCVFKQRIAILNRKQLTGASNS